MTMIEKVATKIALAGEVGEFITEARLEALNQALAAHKVDASQIISIFQLPAQAIANARPARYQVLYRKG
jgi:hypothetical protein